LLLLEIGLGCNLISIGTQGVFVVGVASIEKKKDRKLPGGVGCFVLTMNEACKKGVHAGGEE